MSALPGTPEPLVITLRLEASPELLAVLAALTSRLQPLISFATNFPAGAAVPAGSTASAAHAAGGAPADEARVSFPVNLPAAATQTAPPAVLSGGGMVKRGNRFGTYLKGPASWRTAERAAVVRELWPTATPTPEIFARCNELPGPLVPKGEIANWAFTLGLKRPPGTANPFRRNAAPVAPEPAFVSIAPVPAAAPPAAPAEPIEPATIAADVQPLPLSANDTTLIESHRIEPSPETAVDPPAIDASLGGRARIVSKAPTWTEARIAVVRRDYRRRDHADLLAHVNALPGAPISEAWLRRRRAEAAAPRNRRAPNRTCCAADPGRSRCDPVVLRSAPLGDRGLRHRRGQRTLRRHRPSRLHHVRGAAA